ncbi:hypothetical protein H8H30_14065, partial [Staphylococcus aureus]|uniref:hypothetical protein n=1 Tax=Staphylococcus aureus TaxID=1280 RepID=UPI00167FFDD7
MVRTPQMIALLLAGLCLCGERTQAQGPFFQGGGPGIRLPGDPDAFTPEKRDKMVEEGKKLVSEIKAAAKIEKIQKRVDVLVPLV